MKSMFLFWRWSGETFYLKKRQDDGLPNTHGGKETLLQVTFSLYIMQFIPLYVNNRYNNLHFHILHLFIMFIILSAHFIFLGRGNNTGIRLFNDFAFPKQIVGFCTLLQTFTCAPGFRNWDSSTERKSMSQNTSKIQEYAITFARMNGRQTSLLHALTSASILKLSFESTSPHTRKFKYESYPDTFRQNDH